ncbi:MAG: flagellar motor switch phosphatase FliY [Firmicutes bacterium HGW-Firmicutes-7]|nr:MAG: flagellar motor switch phosphatase FliY [Firmicutes bacterium HGW-Firmicutes-7]
MGEMLSQEEINALLKGIDDDADSSTSSATLSEEEIDAIGEVSNISMGTAATTLFSLVNQKVLITTPRVEVTTWDKITSTFEKSFVAIQIVYKEGLSGSNLMVLKEIDVKIISDLMMGGEGVSFDGELSELHLSAIGEAMNQMIGSASTSMSSMFGKKIDINPPISNYVDNSDFIDPSEIADFLTGDFIKVSFDMKIGDLIDSEIMQLYPIEFAQDIYKAFSKTKEASVPEAPVKETKLQENVSPPSSLPQQQDTNTPPPMQQNTNPYPQTNPYGQPNAFPNAYPPMGDPYNSGHRNIEVQQAQFQNFDINSVIQQKENIDLIMDVALEVTVELGRTHKSIKDILEFAPGTIIELNKLAGEPIDVLVNGKIVAKGEVVVIDENFGIRITEIIKHSGSIM